MKSETASPAFAFLALALAAAVASVVASGIWLRKSAGVVERPILFADYEPLALPPTAAPGPLWAAAEGADLFTMQTRKPPGEPEPAAPEVVPLPGLVRIERELFPIQLSGFVRGAEGLAGVFESVATGRHFLARAGEAIPGLGVRVLEVRLDESVTGARAIARVLPDGGAPLELSSTERLRNGFAAVLQLGVVQRRVRVGESFAHEGARYRLQAIEPDPAAVVVHGGLPGGPESAHTIHPLEDFSP